MQPWAATGLMNTARILHTLHLLLLDALLLVGLGLGFGLRLCLGLLSCPGVGSGCFSPPTRCSCSPLSLLQPLLKPVEFGLEFLLESPSEASHQNAAHSRNQGEHSIRDQSNCSVVRHVFDR